MTTPASTLLRGGSGADRLFNTSSDGQSQLSGGPGDDLLSPPSPATCSTTAQAAGPVTVDLRAGTAVGEGNDTIVSGSSTEVWGSAFDDTLLGGPDDDLLSGLGGADFIDGRGGGDVHHARQPRRAGTTGAVDRVIGGSGNDTVSLSLGAVPT